MEQPISLLISIIVQFNVSDISYTHIRRTLFNTISSFDETDMLLFYVNNDSMVVIINKVSFHFFCAISLALGNYS